MRKRRFLVIWPAYLDSLKTRSEGRRVPRRFAVRSPSIKEIVKALDILGISYLVEMDKAYPREWWVKGRVLVDAGEVRRRGYTKEKLLRAIGETIVKNIRTKR